MMNHLNVSSRPGHRHPRILELAGQPLTIDQVVDVAKGRVTLAATEDPEVHRRMRKSQQAVSNAVGLGHKVYGVTTGFGGMSDVAVAPDQAATLQNNLLWFLATGAGDVIHKPHIRAAMLLRANMLMQGMSGVRAEIPHRLLTFLNADVTPVVRELGSIGASGDLVPLAALARAITGHGAPARVTIGDQTVQGTEALSRLGLEPLELLPKEGLAIVNGTSFSSGIAANCVYASRQLLALTLATHAMMVRGMWGHEEPFHAVVHQSKPHPGQIWSAEVLRKLLQRDEGSENGPAPSQSHVQDCYSLRCLPQYIGPIVETLTRVSRVVRTEMNSVTDNPLIDPESECFYQSGNFLGQYIGVAMDDLRRQIGLLAKHLDVQIAQLVSPEFSRGLSASLKGNESACFNMGLKGLQITGNSIMPQLTYLGNPIVEHYPTHAEQFNQNVNGLSWGSANLAWQSVELYRHYVSIALIFAVQALDLRTFLLHGHYDGRRLIGPALVPLYDAVYRTTDCRTHDLSPLIYNDCDQSFEDLLDRLSGCIAEEGSLIEAVRPLVESLGESDG